ncbi:MAG: MFS transporter [Gimesia sp.]
MLAISDLANHSSEVKSGGGTSPRLNWLNFFAADVGDGVGPFLATFLISTAHWNEMSIGVFLLVLNFSTVIAQAPAGWLIDHTRYKRYLVAIAAVTVALCVMVPAFAPQMAPVLISASLLGFAAAFIPPAISAITLGIVGPEGLTKQTGSNQAFNHAGNVLSAVLIGVAGSYVISWGVSPIVAVLACSAAVMVLLIPEKSIDHVVARGGMSKIKPEIQTDGEEHTWRSVFSNRPLLIFMACIGMFHLANASMLPMAGQKLALSHKELSTLYLSICVIIAQFVMIGVSILIGLRSDSWGRKRFLLVGFAVLPLRGLLFAEATNPMVIMSGQILDGIGAGIYGVIVILVVADLTRGTGVFNFAMGVVVTVQGLGASFGSFLGEWWAGVYGYTSSYMMLTALGVIALLLLAIFMPETHPDKVKQLKLAPDGADQK